MAKLTHRVTPGGQYECPICGQMWMGRLEIWLESASGYCWIVCPDCVRLGSDGVAERLLVRASNLTKEAASLRTLADEMRSTPPRWPTKRQLASAEAAAEGDAS